MGADRLLGIPFCIFLAWIALDTGLKASAAQWA
jgi:hypothetical protein